MLVRRIARPLLAGIFISGGINALRNTEGHAQMAASVATPIAEKADEILPVEVPQDPEDLVKIDAAVKIAAGTALALGRFPRIASLLLAGSLVPTTLAAHRFWEDTDPQEKAQNQIHFFKNLGLLGGLMLAAVDTEGKPSAAWWTRRAAQQLADSTRDAATSTRDAVVGAAGSTREAAGNAAGSLRDAVPF